MNTSPIKAWRRLEGPWHGRCLPPAEGALGMVGTHEEPSVGLVAQCPGLATSLCWSRGGHGSETKARTRDVAPESPPGAELIVPAFTKTPLTTVPRGTFGRVYLFL